MNVATRYIALWLSAAALSGFAPGARAEVYKVVDENGNVTYTDQAPGPDARPMVLRELSVISPQVAAPKAGTEQAAEADAAVEGEQDVMSIRELRRAYRDFRIVSPMQEQHVWGTGNEVTIAWGAQYPLQPGMMVTIYVDGQAQPPTTQSAISMGSMDRGEHQVYAELVDSQNRRIALAETVTFFVRQWSVNFGAQQNQNQGN